MIQQSSVFVIECNIVFGSYLLSLIEMGENKLLTKWRSNSFLEPTSTEL